VINNLGNILRLKLLKTTSLLFIWKEQDSDILYELEGKYIDLFVKIKEMNI